MKTLSSFLIIFIFILTILTLNSPPSSANQSINACDKIVCDANWQHVRFDTSYRLGSRPLYKGEDDSTLGVNLESTFDDHPCPRNAVLVKEDGGLNREYFRFTSSSSSDDPGDDVMVVETPFLISVVEKSGSCNETDRYLRVTGKNQQLGFLHVTGDGEVKTWSTCFRFVNFPNPRPDLGWAPTYMLQLCPDKCGAADVGPVAGKCYRVGNVTKGEHVYLKVGGKAFEFALRGKDFGNLLDAYV